MVAFGNFFRERFAVVFFGVLARYCREYCERRKIDYIHYNFYLIPCNGIRGECGAALIYFRIGEYRSNETVSIESVRLEVLGYH